MQFSEWGKQSSYFECALTTETKDRDNQVGGVRERENDERDILVKGPLWHE